MSRNDYPEEESSNFHRFASVFLRICEFCAACIVLGILSRFVYLLGVAQVSVDGRIIYSMVVACIAIVYSFFFSIPIHALFIAFPFDFIMFAMWLVAFCLLETKTGTAGCNSIWFNNYWGYYWGRYWTVGPAGTIYSNRAGCGQWRTMLAFSFMTCIAHLLSGFLGVYVFHKYVQIHETADEVKRQATRMMGRAPHQPISDRSPEMETGQIQPTPVVPPATNAPQTQPQPV